ncbi:MAG: hypothetical protein WCL39_10220 [Armatimonadota bacterium]
MSKERRALVGFIAVACVLVVAALWIGNWLAAGGLSHAVAKPGQIVFISDRDGTADLWTMDADGSNATKLVTQMGNERETTFASTGQWVFYTCEFEQNEIQIGRVRPNGRASGKLLSTQGAQTHISTSPKLPIVSYISNSHVFVCTTDGQGAEKVLPSHVDEDFDTQGIALEDVPPLRKYSDAKLSSREGWIAAKSQGFGTESGNVSAGERAYISTGHDTLTVTLLDTDKQPVIADECSFAWSPDGSTLALATVGAKSKSFLALYAPKAEVAEGKMALFLQSRKAVVIGSPTLFGFRNPTWSPRAKLIAFEMIKRDKDGGRQSNGIWVVPVASGPPKQIVKGNASQPNWSPNGKFILYEDGADLMRVTVATGETKNLTGGQGTNRDASWSPILK